MRHLLAVALLLVPACGPGDKDSATGGSTTTGAGTDATDGPTTTHPDLTTSTGAEASTDTGTAGSTTHPDLTTSTGAEASTDTGTAGTTGGAEVDCSVSPQVFPAFDKTCAAVDDCFIALHTDCCGPLAIGLRKGQEDAFAAAEAMCGAQCPPLGCDHQTTAEDGKNAPQDSDVQVACTAEQCMTFVP